MQSSFSTEQYQKLSATLRGCLQLPVPRDVSPFLVPSHSENALSSMQRLVLRCVGGVVTSDDIMRSKNASDQSEDQVTEVSFQRKSYRWFVWQSKDLMPTQYLIHFWCVTSSPEIIYFSAGHIKIHFYLRVVMRPEIL